MDSFAVTEGMIPEHNRHDGRNEEDAKSGKQTEETNKFQRAISAWRGVQGSNRSSHLMLMADTYHSVSIQVLT